MTAESGTYFVEFHFPRKLNIDLPVVGASISGDVISEVVLVAIVLLAFIEFLLHEHLSKTIMGMISTRIP